MSNPFANWTPEMVAAHNRKFIAKDMAASNPIYEPAVESKADQQSEKELQELCANYLRQLDIPFNRNRMDRKSSGTVGWPDFSFPFRGKFFAVEFKVGSNHTSPEQARCLAAIERNGGIAVVIRDFEAFRQLLKAHEESYD